MPVQPVKQKQDAVFMQIPLPEQSLRHFLLSSSQKFEVTGHSSFRELSPATVLRLPASEDEQVTVFAPAVIVSVVPEH